MTKEPRTHGASDLPDPAFVFRSIFTVRDRKASLVGWYRQGPVEVGSEIILDTYCRKGLSPLK